MTIVEARNTYGDANEGGYVSCMECPIHKDRTRFRTCSDARRNGFEACWTAIAEYMTEKESDTNNVHDVVNHPTHYTQGGIECIDAMEAAFGAHELAVYCKIAAFKYIWRCEHKNGLEDVKKAVWYLNKYIELMEKSE